MLWTRRRKDAVAGRMGLIVFGSLFYWISTMRTARYGMTPILLTPLLLAPNFLTMLRLLRPSLRIAATGVLLYSFLFSVLPTLIISNSLPQFLNLTGQLSDEDYVAKSFQNARAFQMLDGLASREDDILLVGSCEAGAAPFPWKVTCCGETRKRCTDEVIRESAPAYRYVILPKRMDPATLGAGWSPVATPLDSRSIVYSADRETQSAGRR